MPLMSLAIGDRVGPYEVVALLGRGGMGEVWRARDPRLNRDVAIKALPAEFARDRERDRFMSVEIGAAPELAVSPSRALFSAPFQRGGRTDVSRQYDVSRDGNTIVALQPVPREPIARHLAVVTNWAATFGL